MKSFQEQIVSLGHWDVLIEQDFISVEVCRRSSGWTSQHYLDGDEVYFESLDLKLVVEEIYRWVEYEK